jgi:6-phosphofructokinase 2
MSQIVTITFNPALDKSITIHGLAPEKKLKSSVPLFEAGGGGINVSRAVNRLGGKTVALYLAGGYIGKEISRLLSEESIISVPTEIKGSTRENLLVFDSSTSAQYLFDLPGPIIKRAEWVSCINNLEALNDVKYIVISGSLPPGVPMDIFKSIALIARRINAKLVVDTAGEALKKAMSAGVYLVKPNLKELGILTGRRKLDEGDAAAAALELIERGYCEVVVVSMGAAGAILVNQSYQYHVLPPEVKIKSTVGAGDSLLAGILFSLNQHKTLKEAVEFGVACGAAATINPGTELCRKDDAYNLYEIMRQRAVLAV